MSMRILHTVQSLKPDAGSIAIGLRGLLKSLADADVASTVVTCESNAEPCEHADIACAASADLHKLVERADVLHLHGLNRDLTRRLAPLAKWLGVPYVISPLGACSPNPYDKPRWRERMRRAIHDKSILRGARAITVLNEVEGDALRRQGLNGRICVLPYGVDFSEFETPTDSATDAAPDMPRTLLVLGHIHPDQGLVPLMRAIAELGHDFRGWQLLIAGADGGGWLSQLEAAVERKGASNRVAFVLDPDAATQRQLLSQASLAAAPALRVCCPIGVEQALAAGVPVIASNQVLSPGAEQSVRVCEPTRDALRETLRELIQSANADGARLSTEARESARHVFDWTFLRDKYMRLYRSDNE